MSMQFGETSGRLRWLKRDRYYSLYELARVGFYSIDASALYGVTSSPNVPQQPSPLELYQGLIPGEIEDWNPLLRIPDRLPKNFGDWVIMFGLLAPSEIFPFSRGTPGTLTAWLRRELDLLGLQQPTPERLFLEPWLLIKVGNQVLRHIAVRPVLDWPEGVVGLVMVGLGAIVYAAPEQRCEVCFRRKAPGLARCRIHSQSKLNIGADSRAAGQRAQSSRIALRAAAADETLLETLKRCQGPTDIEHVVASILWPTETAAFSFHHDEVKVAIESAPHVCELLPPDFLSLPAVDQVTILREHIDPEEWSMYCWPDKIREAERWLMAEKRIAPGRQQGLCSRNKERVVRIQELLERGLPKNRIARELGISRSHLSHLLHRARLRRGS